jgi:hypothetical protein
MRFKSPKCPTPRARLFEPPNSEVINRGQSDGVLVGGSPQVLSHLTASLVESVGDPTFEPTDPEHYADAVANYAVRGLLSRPTELAAIRRRALDLVAVTAQ